MKLITRVCTAIFFGLMISLYYVQYDARFINAVEKKLRTLLATMFACDIQYVLTRAHIIPLALCAEQVALAPLAGKAWHWEAQSASFDNGPLLMMLLSRRIGLDIVLKDVYAYSSVQDGAIAIADHLKKLFFEVQDLPVSLRTLMIHKGCFELSDPAHALTGSWLFSGDVALNAQQLKMALNVTDGMLSWRNVPLMHNTSAQIHLKKTTTPSSDQTVINAEVHCVLDSLSPDDQDCYITAFWDDTAGSLSIHNKTNSLMVTATFDRHHDTLDVQGSIALGQINNELFGGLLADMRGTCLCSMHVASATQEPTMQATVTIDALCYKDHPIGSLVMEMQGDSYQCTGTYTLQLHDGGIFSGELLWDQQKKLCHITCCNETKIATQGSYWEILPHDVNIACSCNASLAGSGTMSIGATHAKVGSRSLLQGNYFFDEQKFCASGMFDIYPFELEIGLAPCRLNYFTVMHHEKTPVAFHAAADAQAIEGDIQYSFIRSLLEKMGIADLKGDGVVHSTLSIKDYAVQGALRMDNAYVRIGQTYNIVHAFKGDFIIDPFAKKCVVCDAVVTFNKGTITSRRATVRWDNALGLYMHVPVIIEKMFVNMQKDLFAEISGALLLSKNFLQEPLCKGVITIDRGQSKKNIFASNIFASPVEKNVYNCGCDLIIKTKEPFHIRTPFLKTEVILSLVLKNNFNDPHLMGTISLLSGTLKFPYRDLYITKGSLYFLPHQIDDPAIELIARGMIKNYQISMTVSGSLKNPHISFESTPALHEEQIITLLLAGSQEGSLALVMPSVVMQNIQALLFDPEQTADRLDKYFKNLLNPLRRIRIVPGFSDQTGRGGFRGAIEIDVSDRLHGLIQKNFSLSEDTKFELEYLLSDEVMIRGIKDERGDLGGEVEMRLKF